MMKSFSLICEFRILIELKNNFSKYFNYFFISRYTEESQDLFSHFPSILFAKDPENKASLLKKLSEEAFPNKMNYFQGVLAKNNTGFLVGSDLTPKIAEWIKNRPTNPMGW